MDIASTMIVFILTWWMVLFMVLPWGVEMEGANKEGTLPAAPKRHNVKKKMLITTGIAFVLTFIIVAAINANVVDFRSIANGMFEEDFNQ